MISTSTFIRQPAPFLVDLVKEAAAANAGSESEESDVSAA